MARTSIYSDVDISLPRQTDGDITRDIDTEAVKNSLKNIVNTMQGSRRMLPEFAVDIHRLLFEPIDPITARSIGERLLKTIKYWDDRVQVNNIDIEPRYDTNSYRVRLNFTVLSKTEEESIDFVLKA